MSASTANNPSDLISDMGNKLVDALNVLARLSALVRTPTFPVRQRAVPAPVAPPVVRAPAPVEGPRLRPRYVPPVAQAEAAPRTRQSRRQGAADRIVAALLSPTGVLASDLRDIAGYPCGPTVIGRLAATRGFEWYETGEGAKRRFIGNVPKKVARRR